MSCDGVDSIVTHEECCAFLSTVKEHIDKNTFDFIRGKKEKYSLSELGIHFTDAIEMVKELTPDHYYKAPRQDHAFAEQQVWEFGIDEVFEEEYPHSTLYIKITTRPRKNDLVMLSFHSAEFPINYPLKTKPLK